MRKLILTLLAVAGLAYTANTTVTGTITAPVPTGDLISGTCSFQAMGADATGIYRTTGPPVVVSFTGGVLNLSLVPTESLSPSGQVYRVNCSAPYQVVNGHGIGPLSAPGWPIKYWRVPMSATPVPVAQVEYESLAAAVAADQTWGAIDAAITWQNAGGFWNTGVY